METQQKDNVFVTKSNFKESYGAVFLVHSSLKPEALCSIGQGWGAKQFAKANARNAETRDNKMQNFKFQTSVHMISPSHKLFRKSREASDFSFEHIQRFSMIFKHEDRSSCF